MILSAIRLYSLSGDQSDTTCSLQTMACTVSHGISNIIIMVVVLLL